MMLARIKSECVAGVRDGLNDVLKMQKDPGMKALLKSYIDTKVNVTSICGGSVNTLWNATNDNTYSTGHKCAAMHLTLRFTDINKGPSVSRSAYTIHETESTYPGCLREKLHVTPCVKKCFAGHCWEACQTVAHWGND
jgi:hypothetical protein